MLATEGKGHLTEGGTYLVNFAEHTWHSSVLGIDGKFPECNLFLEVLPSLLNSISTMVGTRERDGGRGVYAGQRWFPVFVITPHEPAGLKPVNVCLPSSTPSGGENAQPANRRARELSRWEAKHGKRTRRCQISDKTYVVGCHLDTRQVRVKCLMYSNRRRTRHWRSPTRMHISIHASRLTDHPPPAHLDALLSMRIPPPVSQDGWMFSIYQSSQLVIQDYSALQIPW